LAGTTVYVEPNEMPTIRHPKLGFANCDQMHTGTSRFSRHRARSKLTW
jgi:hypothetical protein